MPNRFEIDGRGPSNGALLLTCLAFGVVCALLLTLMLAKSTGALDRGVRVVASLPTVGDGLPPKSDVKFRGVLVGMVRNVTPSLDGGPNMVSIDLDPDHARGIPATVTARIVPGNAFAVSTVQLVEHGPGPQISDGAVIEQDDSLPTQLFQTTLVKLRELAAAVGRPDGDRTLGLLQTISEATSGKGVQLTAAAQGLNRIVTEMNALEAEETGPPTLETWNSAIAALQTTAPELVDSLHAAVVPMRTVAEQHSALANLLSGANHTMGTLRTAMDNNADRLVGITTNLTPVVGVLADRSAKFPAVAVGVNNVINGFFDELWTRTGKKVTFTFKLVVALAPLRLYTRSDCPVYGELRGPSCDTAPATTPIIDTRGLPDPRAYVPPPGTTVPEPGSVADELLIGAVDTPPPPEVFAPAEAPGPP
ncbi:MCE family protein [Mycobacterium sp. ACS4331]|uniref:MlaD family protein n=1 Tax=Mycobacterium sp. ACS4331 TaxID=1834121 RepID=UPI000800B9DB|nr:MCE family protein [Mycobacterium sp. ACS4331]OBF09978.1 hypothetical protein A5727_22050 [Mycobacterium sp. ACS4331]